ncbi:MAG: ACP S-malonyltransferase [Bacteroidetes bacterium]|nr:ACP S-malonyltransferase [Bacteroidota bacterium]MCY4206318.1 ACP S-malonyltransferase [Bacteroidota bacterium]
MLDQSLAILFPGQGSQISGMGKDLFQRNPTSRAIFEAADEILRLPLSEYCFKSIEEDPRALEKLTNTAICQPALYTHSIAVFAALDLAPDLVAGHSVGEYSALHACGALSFEDGLRLVRRRGELMAMAGQGRSAGMTAVIGVPGEVVNAACKEVSTPDSIVVCANYNAPGQVVISGDTAALRRVEKMLAEEGARKLVQLPVSGAFHSPLVSDAREALAQELATVTILPPVCPIYLNVTAQPALDPEHIRARMLEQLTSPVRWSQLLQNMPENLSFIEVGPGRVLNGLVRQTLGRRTDVISISTADAVEAFIAE